MIDPTPLWDFDDPAGSEQRLRSAAEEAVADDRGVLLTQVARALGLQERYDEAHALLDGLDPLSPDVAARISLERGRLLRSAGTPSQAERHFEEAERVAGDGGLDALRIDALHMRALVADPADQVVLTELALDLAARSDDPRARDWDASLLNNLGMAHADAGDHAAALEAFEAALAARLRIGDPARTRVARWMVAWSLRHLGRDPEALAIQRALRAELAAAGAIDPYVDEEIALLEQK